MKNTSIKAIKAKRSKMFLAKRGGHHLKNEGSPQIRYV